HTTLPDVVEQLMRSIENDPRLSHLNRVILPSRDAIIESITKLRQIIFVGFFGAQGLTGENLQYRVGELVDELRETLFEQVRCCLRYRQQLPGEQTIGGSCEKCDAESRQIVAEFFQRLPAIRELLGADVQAAFDSDPAAQSTEETIFCYPGIFAITVQRLAHEFYKLRVPLLPRIMTEHAHSLTGIDIHPGAKLGRSFFIDHGTGVVIGETCEIGENVKLYQGVTLGALSPAFGQMLRDTKRHPTIENDVTIYANTTILGGETIIGHHSTIGGNVFLTSSVPPHNVVSAEPPKLQIRQRGKARGKDAMDFQI
ncbi:MAG: serine acetyltransferase, partial [Phycisphaerae bacterium]|nr:serine acetyltransferase [Phycisphaerae bacterium]